MQAVVWQRQGPMVSRAVPSVGGCFTRRVYMATPAAELGMEHSCQVAAVVVMHPHW